MYGRAGVISGSGARGQNGSNNLGRAGGTMMAAAITTPAVKNYQSTSAAAPSGSGALMDGEWGSLNPNLYQNMSNDQVDWAALAQQWIQMKETLPPEMVPAAPPPPNISGNFGSSSSRDSMSGDGMRFGMAIGEQGEAPMEVEREEEQLGGHQHQQQGSSGWHNGTAPSWQYSTQPEWRSATWDAAWGSNAAEPSKAPSVPSYDSSSAANSVNPSASQAVANWQAKMSRIYKLSDPNSSGPIAGTVQPTAGHGSANQSPLQLPIESNIQGKKTKIPGLMDQVIKLDQSETGGQTGETDEDTTQTINDAKRKLLPAWIREGLEKMEREKQRQADREREQLQRRELLEQRRQAELEALSELESAKKRSKFESDSEEEEAVDDDDKDVIDGDPAPSPVPQRSREEVLQELMIAVRKNLTEILLEVTNEEIALLAKDTLAKTRRKAPTAQALRKTGLASLTGGLGLGIYGDSDEDEDGSGSDGDSAGDGNSDDDDDQETEQTLRSTIKQRQKEFEWTAREIEEQLAQEEAREERKRREYEQNQRQMQANKESQSRGDDDGNDDDDGDGEDVYGAPGGSRAGLGHSAGGSVSGGKSGSRDGETQPGIDKLYSYKLVRSREKRISRFSDPKDTVRQTHITHVAIVSHKPGEVINPMQLPKLTQTTGLTSTGTAASQSGISPPPPTASGSAPLFPAAAIAAAVTGFSTGSSSHTRPMESYHRGTSVSSETPSNASGSYRSGREKSSSSVSYHRSSSHKSKKHKRSRYSRSDDEEDYYEDADRYSHYSSSRRSRSSERSSHSRRRRSYSREEDRDYHRKYASSSSSSYKTSRHDRSRSRSRSYDKYSRSTRRSRSHSRSSSRRRY